MRQLLRTTLIVLLGSAIGLLLLTACGGNGRGGSTPPPSKPNEQEAPKANPIVGLNTHALDAQSLAELTTLQVDHARYTLYVDTWNSSESYRETFAADLRAAALHGVKLLVVVHQVRGDWTAEQFAEWIGARAAEFSPFVEAWQIGNEAWSLPGGLPDDEYNQWMELAYPAIKAASPAAIVVTRAMMDEDDAEDWEGPADVVALHLYDGIAEKVGGFRSWIPADQEVWATEFGTQHEETKLAEWRAMIEGGHGYARVYGYALRTGPAETHGIITADGIWSSTAIYVMQRGWR